ncbi:uracil-DNA glycosylase family protein, partial [Natronoarchaeum mannanilyticum]
PPEDADDTAADPAPPVDADADDPWRGGNWTGMAFTTRHSGRRIRTLLAEAGYGDDAYYTNAVKCFPEGDDGSNREPTEQERANCRPHLQTEIERIDPDVLVPAGKHAAASTFVLADLTLDGFLDTVLDPVDSPEIDPAILPILHPSYQDVWIARLGYEHDEYVAAIGDALDRLTGE